MAIKHGLGNFINGSFINEGTITLTSNNPSCDYEPVFRMKTELCHIDLAVDAAKSAYKSWRYQSQEERNTQLLRLKAAFIQNETRMAEAISLEMGKVKSEALTESRGLAARIDLMLTDGLRRVATESLYHLRAQTRYHGQGVLAVIGPYNFPAHLINAHVIPSILLGNTVVVKPSEVCPKVSQIYAECVDQSGLPNGVVNIVHGDGQFGRALSAHKDIDGVLFTGSYATGRALKEMLLDQPQKILALEMGGKNFAVVMDDADLPQAVLEIVLGAFLTTGQRCTATSRVLAHEHIYYRFRDMLVGMTSSLKPSKDLSSGLFGPLATKKALEKFIAGLNKAKSENVRVLLESCVLPGGAFVTPSIYEVESSHPLNFYLQEELFGPNLCVEKISCLDQAIMRINESHYGLSNTVFSVDPKNHFRMLMETKSGVLNFNRSTNNSLGQMPFGGVKRSGNQRPSGIDAVRYATYPVAITSLAYGESQAAKALKNDLAKIETGDPITLETIALRHRIEMVFEAYGIYSKASALDRICYEPSSFSALKDNGGDFFNKLSSVLGEGVSVSEHFITIILSKLSKDAVKALDALLGDYACAVGLSLRKQPPLSINVPLHLALPESRTMLDRLYHRAFVPAEKKPLVADLERSIGPYLVSIDDNPLILFDAASQIATLGVGFNADTFQNAYDHGDFDLAVLNNYDLSLKSVDETSPFLVDAIAAKRAFNQFLNEKSEGRFKSIAYGAGGAEANEIAFDIARLNGPGGVRIIAFEGAFHGRTIMALQATYNKEKRGPFVFSGFEATFIPFPELKNPEIQPEIPSDFLAKLSIGEIPTVLDADEGLRNELLSLSLLKEEVRKGNVCSVIIEPMQCEGGDRYASNRFFCGLRALTRALKVPLIFDEVQTGFHLGRTFFWYKQLNLVDQFGKMEFPDCVTLAKKAQLGICLSIWDNPRSYTPHVIQLKRGLLQGRAMDSKTILALEQESIKELKRLKEYFPYLVRDVRACGLAFAFDMPSKELANELIEQRLSRGFMAYIAGEKTLRFRLNMTTSKDLLKQLFEKLFLALIDMRDQQITEFKRKPRAISQKEFNVRFLDLNPGNFEHYREILANIEESAYEPGRRDDMDTLFDWLKAKDSIGILLEAEHDGQKIFGYAIGGPLEHASVRGPQDDINRQRFNTFYSANITVDERLRGHGLGRLLKYEQIRRAYLLKNNDGCPRYLYLTSRNRVGSASAMSHINAALGAYVVDIYDNQYGEKGAQAAYYRLSLKKTMHPVKQIDAAKLIDCANSIETPFAYIPSSLSSALANNNFRSLIGSKLTLSNWATPHMVRYSELLQKLAPAGLTHAYFTSGRDEVVDKGLRSLRFHRPDADIAIGFSHQWLGHITAAARSLSHDEGEARPFAFFDWPKVAHPGMVGNKASLSELKSVIKTHPANKFLGIVVELCGEKSALFFDTDFLVELSNLRNETGIPLVFVETASSYSRISSTCFLTDSITIKPNMVLWYTGGQLGHIFVDDSYFVEKPLTLISTWDGDGISMERAYHRLLRACAGDLSENVKFFDHAMKSLPASRVGQGVWHAIKLKDEETRDRAIDFSKKHGVLFGRGFGASLMVCPKPDSHREDFLRVIDVADLVISSHS